MLSNMKIGKKLLVGFGLLTILLILVGGGGFYALWTIDEEMSEVKRRVNQFSDINDAVIAAYNAEIASDSHSATHDPKYHDTVVEAAQKSADAARKAQAIMHQQTDRDETEKVATNMLKYSSIDEEFAEIVKKINVQKGVRTALYKEVIENTKIMAKMIKDVAYKNANDIVVDGKPVKFVADERMLTIEECAMLFQDYEQIRVLCRDFELADSEKSRGPIEKALHEVFDKAAAVTKDLKDNHLKSDEGKKAAGITLESLEKWKKSVDESGKGQNNLTINQNEQDATVDKAKEAADILTKTIKIKINGAVDAMEGLIAVVLQIILAVCVIAVIIGIIAGVVVAKNITTGLNVAKSLLDSVAGQGDLTVTVPGEYLKRKDEIGDLAHGIDAVLSDYHSVNNLADALSSGDWTVSVKTKGELDSMNLGLQKMVEQVSTALGETAVAVEQVATGAAQVASASDSLSQGATESAASLEEITASMGEIGGQTNKNAQDANDASKLAGEANTSAKDGQDMMRKMIDAMTLITKNSQDVQKVIKVIDDISFQTNLLALNAAVEAARAGAHGKGFAVVAEEVRNLASRSAKAAAETSQMIEANSRQINQGAEIATETAEKLNSITEQVQAAAALVGNIAKASSEQAQGISQVSQGLHQIDAVTQQNTAAAEETASVASEMNGQTSQLQRLIAQFRLPSKQGQQRSSAPPVEQKQPEHKEEHHATATPPAKPAAKPVTTPAKPAAKPATTPAKPAAKAAAPAHKPASATAAHPSEPVTDDNWGGGGNAEITIDLDDKNFGKY